ncbi:conserved Plasmodium protein, unknown function [Plasmodium gallinaceum]|uniref:Uncharacterized protein n=1 Tax=Plasmodium gallinaceum TaxID=5849 RepID=A0A1J1H1L4_PLAGA|nr:conserved Plasmodium protein, unknown function [Plasmodium gallinaceum]CRG97205.1 conserved Plasmodium protein, unknown function [Plasmodium gallinaceum]
MKYYLDFLKKKLTIKSDTNKHSENKSLYIKKEEIDIVKKKLTEKDKIKEDSNLKLIKLANTNNLEFCTNVNFTIENIKCNEIRRFYLNNSNNFVNYDGLKCNILSAVYCDKKNILFYLLVFSFTNIDKYYLELIKIHIKNSKTEESIVKNTEFILVNNNDDIKNENKRTFTNIKIAMKIQENKEISQFANQNSFIQDISLDNIFYIIEYRKWNNYCECFENANYNALNSNYKKN